MVNVLKFHCLDIIFINVSYPYFLSSYFFLIYTYVNLFKIEIHIAVCIFYISRWRALSAPTPFEGLQLASLPVEFRSLLCIETACKISDWWPEVKFSSSIPH